MNKLNNTTKHKNAHTIKEIELNATAEQNAPVETIFADGRSHFHSLMQDIAKATSSIEVETYIFHKDHLGSAIADSLAAASRRGVKVRVLVDGAGTPFWSFARRLEAAGVVTRVFHPFPWQLWHWSRSHVKAPFLVKWIYLLLKVNYRNHRKVCIIDQKIAYVGSMNISKCHLDQACGGDNWRDISVRLSNTDLSALSKAFECAWDHRTIKERLREAFREVRKDPVVRCNHTWMRRRILYKNLLRKISNSTNKIWITNAYFVPDNILLRKIKEAAYRGVDVRILLPTKSDVMMMPWASSTFYYSLLKSGVRIFEYLPSNLHAKSLIIDDCALIGSSNLNHRSLLHDLEVDVSINQPQSIETLQLIFLDDLKKSREISLVSWKSLRPIRQRLMGRLVLYIKYWI